jgi:hypothetical protein
MKKVLFPILGLILALGLALPMAAPVGAAPDTMYIVSGDTGATKITTVYNKALGVQTTVIPITPLTPVRAQEPNPYPTTYLSEYPGPYEAVDSTWDNGVGKWFQNNAPPVGPAADWIWETETVDGPSAYDSTDLLYDVNAAKWGRAVLMETVFSIPGVPTSATVHIACDNGYEVWVNGGTHYASAPVKGGSGSGWETSTLREAYLDTDGWQTVGHHDVSADLVSGSNTLYVLAGNEYFDTDDGQAAAGTMYNNPGAAIFQLDIEYEEPLIEVEKDYRYTNVCFEKDNDNDGDFNEDPVDGVDDDGDGSIDEDPVDCPLGSYLGDPLPMDNGNYVLEAVIHPKNDKVRSYNPGQYYAVSTVNVTDDVDTLTIVEDWSDCCEISALNPKKGGGSVVIVQVGGEINGVPVPDPSAAYQIFDATSDAIVVDSTACTATATLEDVAAGTIIYMYVKFGPGLKGETWAGPYGPCVNYNKASVVEEPTVPEDWIEASANLKLVAKD